MRVPRSVWFVLPLALLFVGGLAQAEKSSKRMGDEQRGKLLYERNCLMCHGSTGAGDGPAAASLVGGVPDLRGRVDNDRLDELAAVVLAGRGAMPSYEATFDTYEAKRALRHMIRLAAGEGAAGKPPAKAPSKDTDADGAEGGGAEGGEGAEGAPEN